MDENDKELEHGCTHDEVWALNLLLYTVRGVEVKRLDWERQGRGESERMGWEAVGQVGRCRRVRRC